MVLKISFADTKVLIDSTMTGYSKLPPIEEEMGEFLLESRHTRDDATGHALCWGCGEFGQHGHGYKKEISFTDGALEQFCRTLEGRIKHVGCGSSHTAVVTHSNELYVWGNGNSGQTGCADLSTKHEPQKIFLHSNKANIPEIAGVSCGGRHTMVWLENGNVFGFGNNFNAQLGYDFKEKSHKENQKQSKSFWDEDEDDGNQYVTQPTLLKSLAHKHVSQVACGDKHSILRFRDGSVACVGNNSHGQIGDGSRNDTVVPKVIENIDGSVVRVAAGAHHSLAVTESGEVYVWGFGKACGDKTDDILTATKMSTHKRNVINVAGGSTHSLLLTGNGSIYTWGCGQDGQLGHGDKIRFLSQPRRLKDRHVSTKCIDIACGETFSSAVTEKGLLYMWGKNSHTILPGKPTSHKLFLPHGVNKNFRGGRILKIYCGSWHAIAIIGRPELLLREDDDSGESENELVPTEDDLNNMDEPQYIATQGELDKALHLEDTDSGSESEVLNRLCRREDTKLEREKTTVSIADFYAPTPDINKNYRSPSPEFIFANNSEDDNNHDRTNLNTCRSATLVVQLPVQPLTTHADAACSPMTLTTTSSNRSSSVTTLSRVPSPVQELMMLNSSRSVRLPKKMARPEKKFKEFDPQKYERDKLRNNTPLVSEVVQLSRTSADAFTLPREPTGLSKTHVDFSEMEEIRLKGPRSPEKLSRLNKYKDLRNVSPSKLRELSPSKKDHKSKLRQMDSSMSFKSDSALLESPLFRGSKNMVDLQKRPWQVLPYDIDEERQYKHHVPKQHPRKYNKPAVSESNFGLQISKSKTVIAPIQIDTFDNPDRLAQLRRYADIHNPGKSSLDRGGANGDKLRPLKPRHVSIPTGQPDTPAEDIDQLCIGGLVHSSITNTTNKPTYSSGTTWRDKSEFEKMPPRKLAAGIVKIMISNNELVGAVENPLYPSSNDGKSTGDPLLDGGEAFIVQPLLKKPIKLPEETPVGVELPSIAIKRSSKSPVKENVRKSDQGFYMESEELAPPIGGYATAREDNNRNMVHSRVS